MAENQNKIYDLVFSGFGASSCILIKKLHDHDMLRGKNILIIDPLEKKTNDKTFCFWAKETDPIVQEFKDEISHSWGKISFDGHEACSIDPLRYHHISCEKLYDSTRKILKTYDVEFAIDSVINIEDGKIAVLKAAKGEYMGLKVFDCRTPKLNTNYNKNQNIWQSFIGYKVRFKHGHLEINACTLMDFNIDQSDFTQFVYMLPFSENEALIELTRFGSEIINEQYAKKVLDDHIYKVHGEFEVVDIERGKIPMFMDLPLDRSSKNVVTIGSRANKVKPSTGYAFKNMFAHAERIIKDKDLIVVSNKHKSRFRFYDSLLIYILSIWPHFGKKVFQRLFSVKETRYILRFLDEGTNIVEDISMFSKLHIGIFLRALGVYLFEKSRPLFPVFFVTFIYFLLRIILPHQVDLIMYAIMIIGLLVIGIPHGAIDHKTGTFSSRGTINIYFLTIYLAIMGIVYIAWVFLPTASLIAFIIYSAWHFGQTDMQDWRISSSVISFLWGILFFIGLLSGHIEGLNSILQSLQISIIENSSVFDIVFLTSVAISIMLSIIYRNLMWFFLSSFLALSYYIPLILAFSIYFIFHHSYRGWTHLRDSLDETNWGLYKIALPFNLGAVILFLIVFLQIDQNWTENIAMFFIFISCISLPHILCMHFFYKKEIRD